MKTEDGWDQYCVMTGCDGAHLPAPCPLLSPRDSSTSGATYDPIAHELSAMKYVIQQIGALPPDAQRRMIHWIMALTCNGHKPLRMGDSL